MPQPGLPGRNHVAAESLIENPASLKMHFYITPSSMQEIRLTTHQEDEKE